MSVINNVPQIVNEWNILLGLMVNTKCFHHKISWSKISHLYEISIDPCTSLAETLFPQVKQARKNMIKYLNNLDEGLE